jgi:adenine phosphoribosyltransferase
MNSIEKALSLIRYIKDYPSEGILFQDITPLLGNADAFATVVEAMSASEFTHDAVAGIEARGFILGSAIAINKKLPFVPIRKKGRLPHTVISREYSLEYGTAEIEIHIDAFKPGQRVLLVDDVLATGGTLLAAIALVKETGATVTDVALLSEISVLEGRTNITSHFPEIRIHSLLS